MPTRQKRKKADTFPSLYGLREEGEENRPGGKEEKGEEKEQRGREGGRKSGLGLSDCGKERQGEREILLPVAPVSKPFRSILHS